MINLRVNINEKIITQMKSANHIMKVNVKQNLVCFCPIFFDSDKKSLLFFRSIQLNDKMITKKLTTYNLQNMVQPYGSVSIFFV